MTKPATVYSSFPPVPVNQAQLTHVLFQARKYRRMTQTELARQLGVSRQIVFRWERGAYERACWANILAVMKILQVKVWFELE